MAGAPGSLHATAQQIHDALTQVGFFVITGHGIPDPLIADVFAQARRFHDMPMEAKVALRQEVALADEINHAMPHHVVTLVTDALNDRGRALRGSRLLVLGVTYKRDVNDVRESPALEIIGLLRKKGASVAYADPYVPELQLDGDKLVECDFIAVFDHAVE